MNLPCAQLVVGILAMAGCATALAGADAAGFQVRIVLRAAPPVLPPIDAAGVVGADPGSPGVPQPSLPLAPGDGLPPPAVPVADAAGGQPKDLRPVPANGICINQGLSLTSAAMVRVACSSGQFVGIDAIPGVPFLGVHGGAFRYLPNGTSYGAIAQRGIPARTADAPVIASRVVQASEVDGLLQMLVTF